MLFSGIPFLFYFLPAVLLVYFAVPRAAKNGVLLFFSLIFYAWGEPKYVILMIIMITVGYVFGRLIEKFNKQKKALLWVSVAINVIVLFIFKYSGFGLALPIGISFYTFQIISYLVDVYRGEVASQTNYIDFGAYVSSFPQLIAGPIVRYSDIDEQLKNRVHTLDKASYGASRFIIGLSKKVIIANNLGELCSVFRASGQQSVAFYWLYAIAFTLHIYFDFSGYSDMAIGLGKIFGFDFPENFNYPYISKSITEFWRRWHMSLGKWFRDYVYIPLGGNRKGNARWYFNILVVWMLTGLWHGAALNFVVWGLFFAVFLVIEKKGLLKILEKSKVLSHIYVMLLVILGFVIFNADSMSVAVSDIVSMFGGASLPLTSPEFFYQLSNYGAFFILGIIGATPLCKWVITKLKESGSVAVNILEPFVLLGLLILITAFLVDGSYNPFLYFRF